MLDITSGGTFIEMCAHEYMKFMERLVKKIG